MNPYHVGMCFISNYTGLRMRVCSLTDKTVRFDDGTYMDIQDVVYHVRRKHISILI